MKLSFLTKEIIFVFFILLSTSANGLEDDDHTCSSDTILNASLGKTTDNYPSKGTTYNSEYITLEKNSFKGICKSSTHQKGNDLYKAVYLDDDKYQKSQNGYIILNDYVEVKTDIFILNQGYVSVPFSDVSNKLNNKLNNKQNFSSGSKGKISVRLRKSILSGKIPVPSFSVALFHRFGPTSKTYSEKPLAIVQFNTTEIPVDNICDITNFPINKNIEISSKDIFNHDKEVYTFKVNIVCQKEFPGEEISLNFEGDTFPKDKKFFKTNNNNFGVGILDENKNFINNTNKLRFFIQGKRIDFTFKIVPYLIRDNGAFESDTVEVSLKGILSKER